MISGEIEVNSFTQISLILEEKFRDTALMEPKAINNILCRLLLLLVRNLLDN